MTPFIIVFSIKFFKIRITTREDIEESTDIPLFGFVPFVKALIGGKRTIVIEENRNSIMMEAYRQLRSTLPFVMSPDDKVILFTSCVAGEGKTSVACNLGTSMAFTGKRVLLMGLDIRKPRLAGLFNLDDEAHGISNYLTRNKDDFSFLEGIIQHTAVSKNLDIIPAGTIPPNPAELLSRPGLANAIDHLKTLYDFIILDTAPLGLVSDTLSLTPLADVTFFVMRANYSLKADVQVVNNYKRQGVFKNINIILNAVKLGQQDFTAQKYGSVAYGIYRSYGNGYGYGGSSSYGYGYGYGENKKLEEV
jgi:capsular exopolysaccharide synthesis family protein